MLKDLMARNKAAEALGLTNDVYGHWLSKCWPEMIPISALSKWQFPGDKAAQEALKTATKSAIENEQLSKNHSETHYWQIENPTIGACDFVPWLKNQGFEASEHIEAWYDATVKCTETVASVGAGSEATKEPKQKAPSKLEKQKAAILEVIKAKQFNPMAIPDGKKTGTIQLTCENEYAILFNGSTSFDRAWKSGMKSGLWKMEHHESYAHRGK